MIDVITLSSKGQLVIPKDIRESLGLEKNNKFLVTFDNDSILLKKIKEDDLKKKMNSLMKVFAKEFKQLTKEDLRNEIKKSRK
jgi:AbrB family looped-hinge helix DNA binding protein